MNHPQPADRLVLPGTVGWMEMPIHDWTFIMPGSSKIFLAVVYVFLLRKLKSESPHRN